MYRTQCVLSYLALYVGSVHSFSWDIVVTATNQLQFYNNNGTLTHTEIIPSLYSTTSIAYDPVHNRVLVAGLKCIFSFDIATRQIQSLVTGIGFGNIWITYDPVTQLLFWTIKGRRIHSILLKPGSNNAVDTNLLIDCDNDSSIKYIAVDSCGGYIYWTTSSKIERARFDGSERQVVIDKNVSPQYGIAIDQQTQKMYWFDIQPVPHGYKNTIESADLNGENRRTFCILNRGGIPMWALTVSKDSFYWRTNSFYWQISKNPPRGIRDVKPKMKSIRPLSLNCRGIASNYKIEDQPQGIQNCQALKSLPTNSVPSDYDSLNNSTDISHGVKVSGESRCECTQGHIDERCDVSVCHNYCFQGDCSVSAEGQPQCRCNAGYTGERCEINACQDYCLNNGVCSLNEESEPVCQCTGHYEGKRCDVSVCQNYCLHGDCSANAEGQLMCRCNASYSGERCEVNVCHEYCFNNGVCSLNEESEPVCQCPGHYEGERCDISVCQNYCFQGDCSASAEGQLMCRCKAGYSGERCEVNVCHEYCSNNGVCSLNEQSEPVCQCTRDYEGERCNVPVSLAKCFKTVSLLGNILNTDVTPVTLDKGVKSTCAPTAA